MWDQAGLLSLREASWPFVGCEAPGQSFNQLGQLTRSEGQRLPGSPAPCLMSILETELLESQLKECWLNPQSLMG